MVMYLVNLKQSTFLLEEEIHCRLKKSAGMQDVTMSSLVNKYLDEGLDHDQEIIDSRNKGNQ